MRKMLPAFFVTLALLAFSLWALPQLPDKVATHWGLDGQPDGRGDRLQAPEVT